MCGCMGGFSSANLPSHDLCIRVPEGISPLSFASRHLSQSPVMNLRCFPFLYKHRSKPCRNVTRRTGWCALPLAVTALISLSRPRRKRRTTPDTSWRRSNGRMTPSAAAGGATGEARQQVLPLSIESRALDRLICAGFRGRGPGMGAGAEAAAGPSSMYVQRCLVFISTPY